MKVNKKTFIILPILIAIFLFIALYVYFNNEDSNSFTVSERKWLQNNKNIIENFEIISDYPIYGSSGVTEAFVNDLSKATELEFNIVPYYRGNISKSTDFKFKILKGNSEFTDSDILLNEEYEREINMMDVINEVNVDTLSKPNKFDKYDDMTLFNKTILSLNTKEEKLTRNENKLKERKQEIEQKLADTNRNIEANIERENKLAQRK